MSIEAIRSLKNMIDELEKTTSSISKKEIIKKYLMETPNIYELIYLTYNTFQVFSVTSKVCNKKGNASVFFYDSALTITDLLYKFIDRTYTGQDAWDMWVSFLKNIPFDLRDTCNRILDKDFKCGVSIKTINSTLSELNLKEVPFFEVALAEDYNNEEFVFDGSWYASRKLDGVRCSCLCSSNDLCKTLSRTGKEFWTLNTLKNIIGKTNQSFTTEGELSLITEDDSDDFYGIMREIRRKNHDIKNIRFNIFDLVYPDSNDIFSVRQENLKKYIEEMNNPHLRYVEQIRLESKEQFLFLKESAIKSGWEGLILRKDTYYKHGRSRDVLKVKEFKDIELEVVDIDFGEIRIEKNNNVIPITCMTRVFVDYKGYKVGVGSGWTIDDRIKYYNNPELILNKKITVKYFDEIKNEDGSLSLKLPTVKYVYIEERDL